MAELKQLSDYFDPMKTGMQAMQVLQGQQQLGLQAQNAETNAAQQKQQAAFQQDQVLMQAYEHAPVMSRYPLYKQIMERRGVPAVNPDKYYATPEMFDALLNNEPGTPDYNAAFTSWMGTDEKSRKVVEAEVGRLRGFRGAQEMNIAGGVGGSENLAQLTQDNPAVQTQVANAVAQTPIQQAKLKDVQVRQQERDQILANVHTQQNILQPLSDGVGLAIDRKEPYIASMDRLQEQYDHEVKTQGVTKARGLREERMRVNPDIQAGEAQRKQSIPAIEQTVKKLEEQRMALETRLKLISSGADTMKPGETLPLIHARVEASGFHLALSKAALEADKRPTRANLEAVRIAKMNIDTHLEKLADTKALANESLDIRRDAQAETVQEHRLTRQRTDNIGKAQVAWMQAGGDIAKAHVYAEKFGVKVSEVTEAAKDPNKPLVSVTQNAPGERKDIAEGRSQLDTLKNITTLYNPDFVGPLDARVGKLKSMTGLIQEQEASFRSAVQQMRSELRKFYFGTAQSKQELAGALEAIPDLSMSRPQFEASMKETQKHVKSLLSRQGEVMEQSGVKSPKPKPLTQRFSELEKSGKSREEVFQQMMDEGY